MPKIIENPESKLMEEARRQIEESGYSTLTIRSVAKACGIGIGTVYNYFSSKENLVAAYMLNDWNTCIAAINTVSKNTDVPKLLTHCIYEQLVRYANQHQNIFRDEAAAASFSGSFSPYHGMLRSQLARPLRKFCKTDFASEFIAESLLTWTMAGKSFDEIYGMIEKLF